MNELLNVISENKALIKFLNKEGRLVIQDNLALSYLVASAFQKEHENILVLCNNLYGAQGIYEQLSQIIGEENALLFPVDEVVHLSNSSYSKELIGQRLYVLEKCLEQTPHVLITHTSAITRYLPKVDLYKNKILKLAVGEHYNLSQLGAQLSSLSFTRVNKIDQSLEFALRGDILDIYPVNQENPIRIEFFDDEIESIREFKIESQESFNNLSSVTIFPSSDLFYDEENYVDGKKRVEDKLVNDLKVLGLNESRILKEKVLNDLETIRLTGFDENTYRYYHFFNQKINLLDYFDTSKVVLLNEDDIFKGYELRKQEYSTYIKEGYSNGLTLNDEAINLTLEEALKKPYYSSFSYFKGAGDYTLNIKSIPFYSRNLINAIPLIQQYQALDCKIVVCLDGNYYNQFTSFLASNGILYEEITKDVLPKLPLGIAQFDLKEGFVLEDEKLVYLSKREIFGYKQNVNAFTSRFKKAQIINSFSQLEVGDYVVHNENGIGCYEGLQTVTNDGKTGDYLRVRYANNEILFIPLMRFSTIRKYVSREGVAPRLSRLGGNDWSNTKAKIKEKVNYLAERLISLYAERNKILGYAFKEDDELQEEFENAFPYPLTPDQVEAIKDIKADMESTHPMERLLCGDVGFGKTEVAFRAAFKAINDGKQVALLCPTTILAKQHYDVAMSRFALFGVNIALFSRFVSTKKQNEYIKGIKEGKIHLIIGTHRLLSKEIEIPNLGLLIVDEEQRFGVEHKERIKEISKNIDVLSLSATPIPRTLQMSLVGIRNLSQLQTPPSSRMPIQTYVTNYDPFLIKEAISRELSRGGQVYYLHNRITSIYLTADLIRKSLPQANVGIVHAKMDKDDIDEVMQSFYSGQINVLVCTSIVEAGLDVPNANTLIVEEADTFGLAQLYQIKGRVGRSNRVAYAYLLVNEHKQINDIAQKRLDAIKQFTELGSGIKIAQMDLSIRGAGDILGSEQSGFINNVGMDMYLSILNEVIKEKRGEKDDEIKVKTTNISFSGYIPSAYALDSDKIEIYQEIESCTTLAQIEILKRKLRDIYGRLPKEVDNILFKRKIDILSSCVLIESVNELDQIYITLTQQASCSDHFALDLNKKLMPYKDAISVTFENKKFVIRLLKDKESFRVLLPILEGINSLVKSD